MKTCFKSACLVLLAAWAGSAMSLAQTNPPPAASTNPPPAAVNTNRPLASPLPTGRTNLIPPRTTTFTNPPVPVTRIPSRRFSGKIIAVDSKAQIVTLQGGDKTGIGVTDKTKIVKDKKPATFDALAVGQSVTGMERQVAPGKWEADSLNVGDTSARQPIEEPTAIPAATATETASIHILAPGGASDAEFAFGIPPEQVLPVKKTTLSQPVARMVPGAHLTRSIHVDGGAVVAWYPNTDDLDIICHVTPGKHDVTLVVKDVNSDQSLTIGPLTVTVQAGETEIADFQ